jgi:glucan phosphoethanolaminetransferase (alkaline phosphatase superfamily)
MNRNKYFLHVLVCLLFTIGLFAFEAAFLPFSPDDSPAVEQVRAYSLAAVSFGLMFVFVLAASSSPYIWRVVYLVIFAAAAFPEYGYYQALRHFSSSEDLVNVIVGTNSDTKLDAIALYFDWTPLLPCAAFLVLLVILKPLYHAGLKNIAAVLITSLLFFLATAAFTNNYFPLAASQAFYRTIIAAPFTLHYFGQTRRGVIEYRSENKPVNNIVFIVDESISGSHLSINGYERPTTPVLDELNKRGFVKNWGLAASGTTCSVTSNLLLLTGMTNLPDTTRQVSTMPIVFQYARAMGYKTYFVDGQMDNYWSLTDSDRQFVDVQYTKKSFKNGNDFEIDAEIGRQTREILNESTGNFIWINKRGTHSPYHRAYPKSAELWSPVYFDDPSPTFADAEAEKQAFINSYDNAVKYNSQLFFGELFADGPNKDTAYVYTSDHGQNLRDVPHQAAHCGSAPIMAEVPLLLISGEDLRLPEVDFGYKAAHSNIFATLLDLMNFPEGDRPIRYNNSLLKAKVADSRPRYFYTGSLSGEGMRKIAFDKTLLASRQQNDQ